MSVYVGISSIMLSDAYKTIWACQSHKQLQVVVFSHCSRSLTQYWANFKNIVTITHLDPNTNKIQVESYQRYHLRCQRPEQKPYIVKESSKLLYPPSSLVHCVCSCLQAAGVHSFCPLACCLHHWSDIHAEDALPHLWHSRGRRTGWASPSHTIIVKILTLQ